MEGPAWLLGHGRREPRGKGQMKQGKGKVHRSLSVRIWQPGQTLLLSQNYEAAQSKSKRVPCGGRSSGKQNKHQISSLAALADGAKRPPGAPICRNKETEREERRGAPTGGWRKGLVLTDNKLRRGPLIKLSSPPPPPEDALNSGSAESSLDLDSFFIKRLPEST
ncbi:uncharacterized protein LOC143823687 isoform X2 [Paroedura picta]|uniref:uncharacterized protein LOC143823687 isoform X2 n=1 Tax=Paroedura picta TaxID=143630 RepID=UPI0040560F2C